MRMKEEEWDAIIDTNLKSVYRLSKACLRAMIKARKGRIINHQLGGGRDRQSPARPTTPPPRPAIVGFTKALAREIGSRRDHGQRRGTRISSTPT